jgi:hypothetical protein
VPWESQDYGFHHSWIAPFSTRLVYFFYFYPYLKKKKKKKVHLPKLVFIHNGLAKSNERL